MPGTVLAIDDSPEVLAVLTLRLQQEGLIVMTTTDWKEGIALARVHGPDVILLDVCMPEQSGLDVCRRLKSDPSTADIPVIFLTAKDDVDTKIHGFDLGASDYVTKPFHPGELRARVRTALRSKHDRDQLDKRARQDGLTGLFNRSHFDAALELAFDAATRMDGDIALIMIDLDHFKSINDAYGHSVGDAVLKKVGRLLMDANIARAQPCRFGGEELALILPETTMAAAAKTAEQLRRSVSAMDFHADEVTLAESVVVTASFGVAARLGGASPIPTHAALVKVADRALYMAKNAGRNRVCSMRDLTKDLRRVA
ncbi:MAG: diguanylate cyclase [Deltaproteobacteria bacterium]|nr:diguanylate cyclase [Deltaproteobacteria bacterium]